MKNGSNETTRPISEISNLKIGGNMVENPRDCVNGTLQRHVLVRVSNESRSRRETIPMMRHGVNEKVCRRPCRDTN